MRRLFVSLMVASPLAVLAQTPTPNLMVILDSSGSMTFALQAEYNTTYDYPDAHDPTLQCTTTATGGTGVTTWGDGSPAFPGDASVGESRLHIAKAALTNVINSVNNINLGLMRYHQDEGVAIKPLNTTCDWDWYR